MSRPVCNVRKPQLLTGFSSVNHARRYHPPLVTFQLQISRHGISVMRILSFRFRLTNVEFHSVMKVSANQSMGYSQSQSL